MKLRPDGDSDSIPSEVQKWADPDNHMGFDVEAISQREALCDYCEISSHVRLFSKPLKQLKERKLESLVILQAATALSDPKTGERILLEWDEDLEDVSALTRFGSDSKARSRKNSTNSTSKKKSRPKRQSIRHILGWDTDASTIWLELHITVGQAEGLQPPVTLASSKFWCVIEVQSSDGTQSKKTSSKKSNMVSGAPVWDELLTFKVKSLVGAILIATIYAPTLLHGDNALGALTIPLTGCKILPEWNAKSSPGATSRSEEGSKGDSSSAGYGGKSGKWYTLEPEGSGRVRIRCEAIEVGDVVMI
jgi:hypothetical protein